MADSACELREKAVAALGLGQGFCQLPGTVFEVQDVNDLGRQDFQTPELFITEPPRFTGASA